MFLCYDRIRYSWIDPDSRTSISSILGRFTRFVCSTRPKLESHCLWRTREALTATQAAIRRADDILCLHDTVILYHWSWVHELRVLRFCRIFNPIFTNVKFSYLYLYESIYRFFFSPSIKRFQESFWKKNARLDHKYIIIILLFIFK